MRQYHKISQVEKFERTKTRLFKKRIEMASGCWLWPTKDPRGYGSVYYEGKVWRINRLSLFLFKPTEYKEDLEVLHTCNSPRCFNPDHLYAGTHAQNMQDAVKAGNHFEASKTHCPQGHEYTPENTYIVKDSNHRLCVTCRKKRDGQRNLINTCARIVNG